MKPSTAAALGSLPYHIARWACRVECPTDAANLLDALVQSPVVLHEFSATAVGSIVPGTYMEVRFTLGAQGDGGARILAVGIREIVENLVDDYDDLHVAVESMKPAHLYNGARDGEFAAFDIDRDRAGDSSGASGDEIAVAEMDRAEQFAVTVGDYARDGCFSDRTGIEGALVIEYPGDVTYVVRDDLVARVTIWDDPEVDEAEINVYRRRSVPLDDLDQLGDDDLLCGCLVGPLSGYDDSSLGMTSSMWRRGAIHELDQAAQAALLALIGAEYQEPESPAEDARLAGATGVITAVQALADNIAGQLGRSLGPLHDMPQTAAIAEMVRLSTDARRAWDLGGGVEDSTAFGEMLGFLADERVEGNESEVPQ